MPHDAPRSAEMLKSYKKMSRWYPALPPEDGAGAEDAHVAPVFGDDGGTGGFPHYIRDDDVEVVPPVDESLFRRSHYTGRWSDWVTDRAPAFRLRERPADLLPFPADLDGGHDDSGNEEFDDAALSRAASDSAEARGAKAAAASAKFRRRRLVALAAVLIAVLLLALAGGVALYVLHSRGATAQSVGTMVVGGRTTTPVIPAG
ncbi:hypothetical protein FOH10_17675 [Nocardia otitidiscaviarum]|uniref:Uncharacterized protein n=1 Tax=Nocardia otitidiscaviarum TaxID=1823 RepID=A0A516NMY9_9NOCA|nr:hypothetical protein [Nocardia otitidiscaviarum]QDP80268.1 hypothetical protein FOH10_17675 [Nocardia otitidiscaviarum]